MGSLIMFKECLHHGILLSILMTSAGSDIYLLGIDYVKAEVNTLRKGLPVFLTLLLMSAIMNEPAHQIGLPERNTFNMFFISPYRAPELPVYSMVQKMLPFLLSLGIYVLSFTTASGLPAVSPALTCFVCSAIEELMEQGNQ